MSQLKIGLIGGTGLGQALTQGVEGHRHEVETPFGKPSDAIIETQWQGVSVFVLSRHGPGHLLNPSQIPYRANIFAMKQLGVTHMLASGAVGSLRVEYKPGDLVVVDQAIDRTFKRQGTFFEKAAVHVEFAEPFCPITRRLMLETGKEVAGASGGEGKKAFEVHDGGCYVCMEGPAFSTRAESLMHRLWGGDVIGMTAMPEAKLAREAEIPYGLVALVTDYDCWKNKPGEKHGDGQSLLEEIIGNLKFATANAVELMKKTVERMASHEEELMNCPIREALKLAIWSEKSKIDAEEVQRLAPLWVKYFS